MAENLNRKDLTPFEAAKDFLARAEQGASDLAEQHSAQQDTRSKHGGHNKRPNSQRARAEATGTSQSAIGQAERHVETAETYPALQKPEWKQYHVLEAKEKLDILPEPDRAEVIKAH